MRIGKRDIEVMGWMLEQKFLTIDQARRVFWKDTEGGEREAYRRLLQLKREGYLKTSKKSIYRNVLYMVTAEGMKVLRVYERDRGLNENSDLDNACLKHDVVVTDIRIMFRKWGYGDWASERVITRHIALRRIPDGVVYHGGKCFAIEYESTRKSQKRYEDIFLEYELERQIDKVIYIVDTSVLLTTLCAKAASYKKIRFVQFQDLQERQLNSTLVGAGGREALGEILNAEVRI